MRLAGYGQTHSASRASQKSLAPGATFSGPGYDPDGCVLAERFDSAPVAVIKDLLISYNRFLAHLLAQFPTSSLATPCRIGSDPAVSLERLALDYVAHLEHHLRQLAGPALPYSGMPWPPAE